MKKLIAMAMSLAALLTIWGCDHEVYEITMTPKGNQLEREVTVWRTKTETQASEPASGPASRPAAAPKPQPSTASGPTSEPASQPAQAAVLQRLDTLYPSKMQVEGTPAVKFSGVFDGKLPDDVGGGSGRFTQWKTDMGTVWAYLERFRGNDDQAAVLQAQMKTVDDLMDILGGWVRMQYAGHAEAGKLAAFLDQDLRKDLKNAGVYLWLIGAAKRQPGEDGALRLDAIARIAQYFLERDYYDPREAPAIVRVVFANQEEKDQTAERLLRRILSKKVSLTDEFTNMIVDIVRNPESVRESMEKYVETTPQYKQWQARRQEEAKANPSLAKPEPMAYLSDLSMGMVLLDIDMFGQNDVVTIVLKTDKPALTNGKWDDKARRVEWKFGVPDAGGKALPVMCYAAWAKPDERFQKEHFGKVILKDEGLLEYLGWRSSLTSEQGQEWDKFLKGLRPGPEMARKVKEFRFAAPAAPPAGATAPAATATTGAASQPAEARGAEGSGIIKALGE